MLDNLRGILIRRRGTFTEKQAEHNRHRANGTRADAALMKAIRQAVKKMNPDPSPR